MNHNILTYCYYFIVTSIVVLYVGAVLYKNGRPFLINTFAGNTSTADAINKLLLAGYYLVNIGYIIITLKIWDKVESSLEMIHVLSFKIGFIIITLGIMHLFNIIVLLRINKKANQSIN